MAGRRKPPEVAPELYSLRAEMGAPSAARKLALLGLLPGLRLTDKRSLLALHEALSFIRAFPDSAEVLKAAEAGLRGFGARIAALPPSVRERFDESAIAGSAIHSAFSWTLVQVLRARFPAGVSLFLEAEGVEGRLDEVLYQWLAPGEAEALADGYLGAVEWLERAGVEDRLETVSTLVEALVPDPRGRTALWAALELPISWALGADDDASRTLNRSPSRRPAYQTRPFSRRPIDLREEAPETAPAVPAAHPEAAAWIRSAQHATAARLREMHTFIHGSPDDVSVAELEPGLEISIIGVAPEARYPVRTFYGYLLARNGIPIGYGDAVLVLDWAEVNFHIFDTFRQAESSRTYALALHALRAHFGFSYLFLNRYQFGHHNEDAIRSGAFWFYEKLGFRPREPAAVAIWDRERKTIDQTPGHRTGRADLRRLARAHMSLILGPGPKRDLERDYTGFHPLNLAFALSRKIASEHGGDRRRALEAAIRRIGRALPDNFRGAEALAFEQLAPTLDLIPDLEGWSRRELHELAGVVRAKASREERDYLVATRKHSRLPEALLALGRAGADQNV